MAFERKIKYISELEKKSSPFDLKLRNKVDELKKLIRKGKSTGDNIKDYIIVCTGKVYFNELENKLRGLDEGVKKYQNQQVAVLYKSEYDMEKPIDLSSNKEGLFELSYTITETRWKLGVLDGEIGFNLNNAEVYIPTKNYVEGNDSKNLKLESTGIPVKGYDIVEGYDIFSDLGRNLEILMGDNLVELYFKHPSFPIYILERYATKGNVIDDAFKDERSYKKYTEALKLLNLGKEQEVTSAANTDDLFMHLYK